MNRKQLTVAVALLVAILLNGCAGAAPAGTTQSAPVSGGQQPAATLVPGGSGEIDQAMELALGTLKLEGTPNAVTAEQAAKLLPLWKAARSLSNSDTAAAQEVDAVFKQIEAGMTPEQVAAIDALQIDREAAADILAEMGLQMGPAQNADPGIQATMQAARATAQAGGEGFVPGGPGVPPGGFGGGPMGGYGGMGADSGLSDEARATAQAQRGRRGARVGLPPALIDAVINALEAHLDA